MANHPTPAYLGRQIGNQYPLLQEKIQNMLTEETIPQLTQQLHNTLHTRVTHQDTLNLVTLHLLTQPILHTLYPQENENTITRLLTPITNSLQPLLQENPDLSDRIHQLQLLAQKATLPEQRQNLVRDFLENLINNSQHNRQEKRQPQRPEPVGHRARRSALHRRPGRESRDRVHEDPGDSRRPAAPGPVAADGKLADGMGYSRVN